MKDNETLMKIKAYNIRMCVEKKRSTGNARPDYRPI